MGDNPNGDKKQRTIGNYKIGKVLGTGSYGYVRLGVNTITNEQVLFFLERDTTNKERERKRVKR